MKKIKINTNLNLNFCEFEGNFTVGVILKDSKLEEITDPARPKLIF